MTSSGSGSGHGRLDADQSSLNRRFLCVDFRSALTRATTLLWRLPGTGRDKSL